MSKESRRAYMRVYMRQWRDKQKDPMYHIDRINRILVALELAVNGEDINIAAMRKSLAAMRERYE